MTTRVRSVERHPTWRPQRNSVICPRKPGKNQKAVGRCFTPRQPLQLRVNPLVTPVMKVLPAQEQGALRAGAWSFAGLTLQPSLSRAGHWEHDRADRPTLRHFSLRANSEFSLKSVEVLSGCGLVSLSERRRADCSSETCTQSVTCEEQTGTGGIQTSLSDMSGGPDKCGRRHTHFTSE